MRSTVSSANNKAQDSVQREEMGWITPSTVATVVSACLVAWLLQIIAFSPISPGPSIFQSDYEPQAHFVKNNVLQTIEKLGEGFLEGPEDSAVDGNGLIYTATQDGWIKRMHPNGSWEDWKKVGGSLLGLAVSRSGHIIVCDPERGLLKVSDEEVSIITSEIDGEKIRFVDAVVEGSDGSLYFSDASTKFPYSRCILDFLEGEPYGRLLKYDPQTKKTSVLLDGLAFANGVALPPSEDYVAICETWKHILARYPTLLNQFGFTTGWAMVAKVGEDGTIIKTFDDSNGKVISFLTSAMEVGEYLYLGNLNTKFLGRLNLNEVRQ